MMRCLRMMGRISMTILFVLILNNISMMVPSSSRHVFAAAETVVVEGTCAADDVTCTGSTPPTNPEMEATRTTTSCTDDDVDCDYWANEMNECQDNPEYMKKHCRKSCDLCNDEQADDGSFTEDDLIYGADLGVIQEITSEEEKKTTKANIVEAREYMAGLTTLDVALKELCRNLHEHCAFWATTGECEANPHFMKKECGPSCKSCEYLSLEQRCPLDPDAPNSWSVGDLNSMFVRLTNEPYLSQYETKILSSPDTTGGPWVITLENVVSEEEASHLIELGSLQGYERSKDVGELKADGSFEDYENPGRTSTNAWCQGNCYENTTAITVVKRLSEITGINETNSEWLQLLRYEEGQHYQVHHDYIDFDTKRRAGVRMLTLYLYLNDVENGGGTNFDQLDVTVMPKRGRALLWPSVLDSAPHEMDDRTTHQALPVGKDSLKYGANAWFHQRDYKGAAAEGCD